jgi:hypothetical protein
MLLDISGTCAKAAKAKSRVTVIGTFGLAVGAAWAFSLGIAGQVLTFNWATDVGQSKIGKYEGFRPCPCTGEVHIASGGFSGRLRGYRDFGRRTVITT